MKYADIKTVDVANGPGIRVSLFVSGCRHKCKGCFNYDAWDFDFGKEYTSETEDYILDCLDKKHIKGLTFLGGEPLEPENQEAVCRLIRRIRQQLPEKNLWLYTGFTYEYLMEKMVDRLPYTKDILDNVDVLVDGKYQEDLKDVRLRFRGSANQRLIDLVQTRETKHVTLWDQ
ncbi:MAG: anaerobic ribonucleoside-triphosphate reductase activating protein [Eubacteriales bacterium]|nr:anaerobic ribonucleoside-triphosphate reductase activating protein [Eubacteriales bacterium]